MNDITKNILCTIVAALLLTFIYYIGEKLFYPTPDIGGEWQFKTTVTKTTYNPYKGMILTFNVLLQQHEVEITGSGEKVSEFYKGEQKEYIGAERVSIQITGKVKKKLFGEDEVHLRFTEHGKLRDSSTMQKLIIKADKLDGTYTSTVADQSGIVNWKRGW